MLTREENELLTQVSRGTPCGELLRRYWHPVAAAAELTEEKPIRAVKILGEELVVYRDKKGNFGLVGEHCPHRSASLAYGRVTKRGFGVPIMAGSSIAQVDVSNSRRSRRGARSRIESSMLRTPSSVSAGSFTPISAPLPRRSCRAGMCLSGNTADAGSSKTRSSTVTGCRQWRTASIQRIYFGCMAIRRIWGRG